jgi:glycosyltransferase involved in cell wall biosynthesis
MRIICLSKRRPQGRDLFTQPYGRFYYLPKLLAEHGHEVHLLLLSYKKDPPEYRREGNLHVHSVSALPWGPWLYLKKANELAGKIRPNWVIGFSDIWYGILAQRLALKCGAKSLIDAYDNYESYISWAKPLHWAWHRALSEANAVTAAGPQLANWMAVTSGRASVGVVPMAADQLFVPMDKSECRKKLGLPLDCPLIGYAGALHQNRGIELLFAVFSRLRELDSSIGLVLSGRLAKGVALPDGVHWLGYRPPEQVPYILNSLDLLFVINKPGAFGNYSYPAKLYEAIACGVPVVAADVPGTAWILQDYRAMLAQAGNVEDFVCKASQLVSTGRVRYIQHEGWMHSTDLLEAILSS